MMDFLKPFDIVKANYVDLKGGVKRNEDGSLQRGLFIVINIERGNVLACKLTSQDPIRVSKFFTFLSIKEHPFLMTGSYAQCDKLHTLDVRECIKVGEVHEKARRNVTLKLTSFFGYIRLSLDRNMPSYISPNVLKRF